MELKDSDIKLLMIEALDYNAQVVALCITYFNKTDTKENNRDFYRQYERLSKLSTDRREYILKKYRVNNMGSGK